MNRDDLEIVKVAIKTVLSRVALVSPYYELMRHAEAALSRLEAQRQARVDYENGKIRGGEGAGPSDNPYPNGKPGHEDWERGRLEAQPDHSCSTCGAELEVVRPGKMQCPNCAVCAKCGYVRRADLGMCRCGESEEAQHALQSFVDEHFAWASAMFPDETIEGKLIHLRKEVDELRAEPKNLKEWADCGMLLLHSLKAAGYTVTQLEQAMRDKFAEVRLRKNWVKTADGDYQSVKAQPAPATIAEPAPPVECPARKALRVLFESCSTTHPDWGADICEPDGNAMSQACSALHAPCSPCPECAASRQKGGERP